VNTSDVEADLQQNCRPSPVAESQARLLLEATPGAEMAVIPLVHPGKMRGVWLYGQRVETVPGLIFLACSRGKPVPGTMAYSDARNLSWNLASLYLNEHFGEGTTSYAVVYPGQDHMPVFED
jgi:hypothetical protein